MSFAENVEKYKPGIPKRHLLLIAAFIWLIAGTMLFYRGATELNSIGWKPCLTIISLVAGIIFFWLLFFRISSKHIRRITSLEILKPCVFSFFNFRSYLLMALMITMGITVRRLRLISYVSLSYFFITMAIPLIISSIRFLWAWIKYRVIVSH